MALVETARFLDVHEAQIARSALNASGIDAVLMDEFRAQAIWTEQLAIGGVRLFVPEADFGSARAFLERIRSEGAAASQSSKLTPLMAVHSTISMVGLLIASALFGWPLAAFKRQNPGYKTFSVLWIGLVLITLLRWLRL